MSERRAEETIWQTGVAGQLGWVGSRTESRSGCNMESSKEGMDDDWTEAVYDLQVLQPRILEHKIGSSTFRGEQQICENFLLPKELDWRGTRHLYAGDH